MTKAKRDAEYTYRLQERLGLLGGDGKPTLNQLYLAETEAREACERIEEQDKKENQ